jgi:hypothetical protein
MTETLQTAPRFVAGDFSVGHVFSQAFSVLSRNLLPFCIVAVVAAVPYVFLFDANTRTTTSVTSTTAVLAAGGFILAMVLNTLSQAIILYGAFEDMRGRPVNLMASVRIGLGRFFPVIGTALLMGILVMLGAILLFFPAFIVMAMLFVSVPVCVVERLGPVKSLGRSSELTKGHRWKIFGLWFVTACVGGIMQGMVSGIAGAISIVAVKDLILLAFYAMLYAFSAILAVVAYRDLRVAKEGVDTDQIASVFD